MKKIIIKDYQELEKKLMNADSLVSDKQILNALGLTDGYQVR